MTPQLLNLDPAAKVASGVQRAVYLHPYDDTKLVKVLKRAEDMPKRTNFNGVMDRLMPSTRIRQIRKEYQEYLRVMLRNAGHDFAPPIAHMFGFVQSNIGLGCLTERVVGEDGALGITISKKAKSGGLTPDDLALLNDAIGRLFRFHIRASDLNPKNFVFGHRNNGAGPGPRECVLVDGFGDIHAIPVRSMGKWCNHKGLEDSCKRLARNTGLQWDPASRLFAHPKRENTD